MNPKLKDSNTDDLSPAERRELSIAATAATLVRGLLHEQISDIEDSAAKSAEDKPDSDKPVTARVTVITQGRTGPDETGN
jgi:hypothetical protein